METNVGHGPPKKKKWGGRSYVSSNQHNLQRCFELK